MDKEKYEYVESVYCYTCRKENRGYMDKSGENFIQDYDDWILIDRIEIWGMEMELRNLIEGLDDRMNKLGNRITKIEKEIYDLKKKNWGVSKAEEMEVEK